MDEKQKNAAAEEAGVTLAQKILGMTEDELVEAASTVLAWASLGGLDRQTAQAYKPVIDGLVEMMKPGMTAMMLEMPWEDAVWAIAGEVSGKK